MKQASWLALLIVCSSCILGCGKSLQSTVLPEVLAPPETPGGDGPPQSCPVPKQTRLHMESPFAKVKLSRKDFSNLDEGSLVGAGTKLKSGFPLVVVVDRQCVAKNLAASAFVNKILKSVRPFQLNDHSSRLQSISFRMPTSMRLSQIADFFEKEECVVGVSPERKLQALSLPNDPRYLEQNALTSINHALAWPKISILKENVVVAVVDSGTDLTHPDLLPSVWINPKEIAGNNIDDDQNGYVDDVHGYNNCYLNADVQGSWQIEHGEHIHGIIAAEANNSEGIVGVASPTVKVMHMTIFGYVYGQGQCNENAALETARLEEGIRYAADNGAQVINLSWGARGYSSTTLEAIQYAVSKGAVVVAAAANHAEEITAENSWFPAVYAKDIEGLISVAATDANPASGAVKCAFSNVSNSYVEIAAPGCDTTVTNSTTGWNGILSTMRMSTHQGYGYMAGTSMAAPHVAAAAGLVFAQSWSTGLRPTPAQVETLLMAGSRTQTNLISDVVGGRHLDLDVLMKSLSRPEAPPPAPCEVK